MYLQLQTDSPLPSVCYVILKNPSMRTSTNVFLCSLSMADVTILFLGKPENRRKRMRNLPARLPATSKFSGGEILT